MTETLKNTVVYALSNAFGEDVAIYTEKVRQGLKRPCLFVEMDTFTEKRMVYERYLRTYPVKITYFPKEEDIPARTNAELDRALEKLFYSMGKIKKGSDVFNGSVMEARNDSKCLVFTVNYKTIITKTPEKDEAMMECIRHILDKGSE